MKRFPDWYLEPPEAREWDDQAEDDEDLVYETERDRYLDYGE